MLSDRDALLAAIRANPDEDTPRLMYADWLDESGDADRAEFVRLQCELARLADDGGDSQPLYEFLRDRDFVTRPAADWTRIDEGIHRRLALTMRADDLLKRHWDAWVPKLPKSYKVEWGGFHRGFAHRVALGNPRAMRGWRLRAAAPAVTLVAHTFTAEFVRWLADAGLLGWVGGLDLRNDCTEGLREFGYHPEAAGVRELKVRYGDPDEFVPALVGSPHWTGLRTLDLSETVVSDAAAQLLFRSPHLRGLRRLHVRGAYWEADTVRLLAAAEPADLHSLRLSRCGLTDDGAEALAGCPHLARLRTLDLDHNYLTGRGVTALLCSPHLAGVAFLGLENNPASGLDGKALAALAPGGLRMFHAHGCQLRTADVRALARSPRFRTLWYLDLDNNDLRTPAVRELVRGFGKRCPPIVWMTHNRIDDRGVELLANWKAAPGLRILHLKYNQGMTDAGCRALLDSPHLSGLDGLGVSTENEELNARMKKRFRHHEITYY